MFFKAFKNKTKSKNKFINVFTENIAVIYKHFAYRVYQPSVVSLRPGQERESGRRRAKVKWLWNDAKG